MEEGGESPVMISAAESSFPAGQSAMARAILYLTILNHIGQSAMARARYHIVPHLTVLYCAILASLPWHVPYCTSPYFTSYHIGQGAMARAHYHIVPYCTKLAHSLPFCNKPYCTTLASLPRHVRYVSPYCTKLAYPLPYRTAPYCTILASLP